MTFSIISTATLFMNFALCDASTLFTTLHLFANKQMNLQLNYHWLTSVNLFLIFFQRNNFPFNSSTLPISKLMVMKCQVQKFAKKNHSKRQRRQEKPENKEKLGSSKNSDTSCPLFFMAVFFFLFLWTALINSIEKLPSEYRIH